RVGGPAALLAALLAAGSAAAALTLVARLPAFSLAWPYVAGVLALGAALAMRRSRAFAGGSLALATLVLAATPIAQTVLEAPLAFELRPFAVAIGCALTVLGVLLRAKAPPALRAAIFLVAIAHVAAWRSGGLTASAVALPLVLAAWESRSEGTALL